VAENSWYYWQLTFTHIFAIITLVLLSIQVKAEISMGKLIKPIMAKSEGALAFKKLAVTVTVLYLPCLPWVMFSGR